MRKKYNYLICGYWGENNFGDDLLLYSLIDEGKYDADVSVFFSSNPKLIENDYGVSSISKKSLFALLRSLFVADVFVVGFGGLFNKSNTVSYLFFFVVGFFYSILRSKKVRIERVGIQENALSNVLNRFLFFCLAKMSEYVSVRDDSSYDEIKRYFPEFVVQISDDLALEYLSSCHLERYAKRKSVGVVLMYVKGFDYSNIRKYVLSYSLAGYVINVYVIFSGENDDLLSESVFDDMNVNYIRYGLDKAYGLNYFIESMASNEVFFSMRYHPLICAFLSGSKVVAVPHNSKIRSFVEKYDIEVFNCF